MYWYPQIAWYNKNRYWDRACAGGVSYPMHPKCFLPGAPMTLLRHWALVRNSCPHLESLEAIPSGLPATPTAMCCLRAPRPPCQDPTGLTERSSSTWVVSFCPSEPSICWGLQTLKLKTFHKHQGRSPAKPPVLHGVRLRFAFMRNKIECKLLELSCRTFWRQA
jgi:hypothetical protein